MIEWKPVKDYEGLYEVSSDGRVRSLDRLDRLGRKVAGRIRRHSLAGRGYPHMPLHKDQKQTGKYIHRLVAEAFLGPREGMEVNHINGDKTDNRVENLEWVTPSQNILHSLANGLTRRNDMGQFACA